MNIYDINLNSLVYNGFDYKVWIVLDINYKNKEILIEEYYDPFLGESMRFRFPKKQIVKASRWNFYPKQYIAGNI